jgi:methyltransferase (TIGR00027 family)
MLRAAHYILDQEPKILADSYARSLAGFTSDEELLETLNALNPPDFPRMRTFFALRNRYAEDELWHAVERGVSQYVILGAGLDSFAFRRPEIMRSLEIFEIDHHASQIWKRQRLAELGIEVHRTLHFVPIDFERQTLAEGLGVGEFNRSAMAFFSWLGVTQYLTREAVLHTLREITGMAAHGSELVMQFIVPPTKLSETEGNLVTALARRAAEVGEPFLSYFEPDDLEAHLRQVGFTTITQFGADEATERYLSGRAYGLSLPSYFRIIKARIV